MGIIKRLICCFLFIVLLAGLIGCISAGSAVITETVPNETDSPAASNTVKIYSSMPKEYLLAVKKGFESQYPGLTMEFYFASTPKLLTKISTERQSGKMEADMIWITDAVDCIGLKYDGMLQKYISPEAVGFDSAFLDPDGYFAGASLITVGIGYNTERVRPEEVPKTWEDLTDSKWRGQILMTDPGSSGTMMYAVGALMQDSRYGPSYFQKLHQNRVLLECSTTAAHNAIAKGDYKIGIMQEHLTRKLSANGAPVAFQMMELSCRITTVSTIGLLSNGGKNQEIAKRLYDFILSKDGQKVLARQDLAPVRDLKAEFFCNGMQADLADLHENKNEILDTFDEIFG